MRMFPSLLFRENVQASYYGCSNKKGGGEDVEYLALDVQSEEPLEAAAGTNAGSHRNCCLIIVFGFSSCSGLKKMTRCSF